MSLPSLSRTTTRQVREAGLIDILDKVLAEERLSAEEGLRLFLCRDVGAVGAMANLVRERRWGDLVFFNRNLHINATNVCEATCIFCSFSRLKTGDPGSWTISLEAARSKLRGLQGELVTEVHIVNGLNPDLPFSYYLDLLRGLKQERPDIHLKGFTAVEIHYYSQKYGLSVEDVLSQMREAGLDSLPGGGAEIFHPRARARLCDDKVDAEGWLRIHATAHRMGFKTNCTMLFGSIETLEERVHHLLCLRDLQDQSLARGPSHQGGHFQTFIPLRFHNDNNRLSRLASPTGYDSLRTIAVSRLLLDNIPHIKAYWPMLGSREAQAALAFGASDLDGTVREEHIYHMAGARTPQEHTRSELVRFIEQGHRRPVERDTLYHVLRRCDPPQALPHRRVRLAPVTYTNALPLIRYLECVDVVPGHPSEVAQLLREGQVDLAMMPVGALLAGTPEERLNLRIVPDLCIGCDGAVDSVFLVAEQPPEQWERVVLDGASRTSAILARLLMRSGPLSARLRPGLIVEQGPLGVALTAARGNTAALIIGDAARELPARLSTRIDLGAAWKEWTGLPFVFAVWAGRPDLEPEVVESVRAAGLKGLAALQDGSLLRGIDPDDRLYLSSRIRYPLDDAATMGLMRFAALAQEAGLLGDPSWSLYPPPPAVPRPPVEPALARSVSGERLRLEEALLLARSASLTELGAAASLCRRRHSPGEVVGWQLQLSGEDEADGIVSAGALDASLAEAARAGLRVRGVVEVTGDAGQLVAQLQALRDLQDQTNALLSVVAETSADPGLASDWLRATSLCRLFLDNIPHVEASWATQGPGLGQAALHLGADDFGRIPLSAADPRVVEDTIAEVERNIRAAGFVPVRRDGAWRWQGEPRSQPDPEGRPLRRHSAAATSPA